MDTNGRRTARSHPWLLLAGGGLAVAAGASLLVAGGWLLCRGMASRRARLADERTDQRLAQYGAGVTSGIYDSLAQAAKAERNPSGEYIEDVVEEASDDSFPCSDPPAWTARA